MYFFFIHVRMHVDYEIAATTGVISLNYFRSEKESMLSDYSTIL